RQCRAHHAGRLSVPDVRADAFIRPSRQGAPARRIEIGMPAYPKSGPVTLRATLADYAVTEALKSGAVASELVTFDFCGPKVAFQGFKPMVRERAYDASELAIATFLQAKAYGKPVVLLPAVVMGRFQHNHALRCVARGAVCRPTLRAAGSASAPIRRRPASGCAASFSTNTGLLRTRSTGGATTPGTLPKYRTR